MKKTTNKQVASRQERRATLALKRIGEVIKKNGFTLEEMIERGRELRSQIIEEEYPNVASLVGAAGSLPPEMQGLSWKQIRELAREGGLLKKYRKHSQG